MRIAGRAVAICFCLSSIGLCAAADVQAEAGAPLRQSTNIAPQGLGAALQALAKQRGFQMVYLSDTVDPLRTQGAVGDFTSEEALKALLSGTGLSYRYLNDKTVTILSTAGGISKDASRPTSAQQGAPQATDAGTAGSEREATGTSPVRFRLAQADIPRDSSPGAGPPGRQQAATSPGTTEQLESVVVTGTHITQLGFSSPSPVTVVSAQSMQDLGLTNVGVAVNELPAFRADLTPNTNGFANFNLGAEIANLRGLGAPRTLVLVDGHRFITSTREGSVDMNLIPTIMIDRTEVVTGGASAAYGSDAIAGAVNIILDTRMNGLRAQVDYGQTEHNDGKEGHVALAGGTDFAGGRGHVVAGGEYDNSGQIGNCFSRSYCTTAGVALNLPGPAHDPDEPANIIVPSNYGYMNMTTGGVIPAIAQNPVALRNMQFTSSGALVPYNPGIYQGAGFSVSPDNYSNLLDSNLAIPVRRYNFFTHADYDIAPRVKASLEGSYAYVDGSNVGNETQDTMIGIMRDNAYLPPALQSFFAANPGVAEIYLGRLENDMGKITGDSNASTWRIAPQLKGEFNDDWRWDLFFDYGQNHRVQSVANDRINANFYGTAPAGSPYYHAGGAVDAIQPGGPGTPIVCRSTVDPTDPAYDPNNGCVPVDLFGYGAPSRAAINYVNAVNVTHLNFTQLDSSAGVDGKLFNTWAGAVNAAAGVDYRRNTIAFINDPTGNAFGYYYNYGASYAGSIGVTEAYGELAIPLATDRAWAKALNIDLAAREAWYDNVNDRTGQASKNNEPSWKASLVYDATDWLRLRGTRSQDIRAANFNELYATGQSAFGGIVNPWTHGTDFPSYVSGGNVRLQPEKGETYTVGAVFTPHRGWLDGFRASIDYYNITLRGAIGSLSAQQLLSDCFAGGPSAAACSRVYFQNGYGTTITEIDSSNENLNVLKQSGYDVEADYLLPLQQLLKRARGELLFHLVGTYVAHQITTAGNFTVDRAGMTGPFPGYGQVGTPGVPRVEINGTMTYRLAPVSLTLQGRFVSAGIFNIADIGPGQSGYNIGLPNSVNDNNVPSRVYFNLSGSYDVLTRETFKLQAFGSIENLFDRSPPLAPGFIGYSEPAFFDLIGRSFHFGLRLSL